MRFPLISGLDIDVEQVKKMKEALHILIQPMYIIMEIVKRL